MALLGLTVKNQLFGDDDPMGQTIRVKNVPFEVIGVMARKGQSAQGQDQDDAVFLPLQSARQRVIGSQPGEDAQCRVHHRQGPRGRGHGRG